MTGAVQPAFCVQALKPFFAWGLELLLYERVCCTGKIVVQMPELYPALVPTMIALHFSLLFHLQDLSQILSPSAFTSTTYIKLSPLGSDLLMEFPAPGLSLPPLFHHHSVIVTRRNVILENRCVISLWSWLRMPRAPPCPPDNSRRLRLARCLIGFSSFSPQILIERLVCVEGCSRHKDYSSEAMCRLLPSGMFFLKKIYNKNQ